ncbi:MAG TPA: TIGR03000 domain-containing protein [Gemmataceae bacterium]|jgi:uncharacterized protein (TIGR03000 family)|nr:TIGR03000 domain-containing protein [Gemmataceae bacterium]
MYSVVLMMALTGSADVPAFGHHNGCHGCYGGGCYGGGCYGSSCYGGGCYGSSCYGGGCNGGGHHLFHRRHGCSGGGCYGGCSGYWGGYASGCCGCYGGGCVGGGVVIHEGAVKSKEGDKGDGKREKVGKPGDKDKGGDKKKDKGDEETLAPAPATILVSLPAEAKLTVDGAATQSTSSTRTFASPALEPGRDYYYTLKAEIVRDGQTVSTSRRVAVRAGEQTRVTLKFPVESVAKR